MGPVLPHAIAAVAALGLAAGIAAAQTDYPRRPITLIVPFAAGGPTDVIARIISDHMSRTLGQPIIIENMVGAGGTTASTRTRSRWAIWEPTPPRSHSIPTSLTNLMQISRPSGWWRARRS
jgi:threonine synthase